MGRKRSTPPRYLCVGGPLDDTKVNLKNDQLIEGFRIEGGAYLRVAVEYTRKKAGVEETTQTYEYHFDEKARVTPTGRVLEDISRDVQRRTPGPRGRRGWTSPTGMSTLSLPTPVR